MERRSVEGERPVHEIVLIPSSILSRAYGKAVRRG
jgi:hypothetical protein